MVDVAWRVAIPVVFCFHVVEGLTRKMLDDTGLSLSTPAKRSILYRLIGIIDHDGVVRTGGAEEMSPVRRAVVDAGSGIRKNLRRTDTHNKRQSVCMPMTTIEHTQPSAVEDDLALIQAASGSLDGVTRHRIESMC